MRLKRKLPGFSSEKLVITYERAGSASQTCTLAPPQAENFLYWVHIHQMWHFGVLKAAGHVTAELSLVGVAPFVPTTL